MHVISVNAMLLVRKKPTITLALGCGIYSNVRHLAANKPPTKATKAIIQGFL